MINIVLKSNDDYALIAKFTEGRVSEYVVACAYNGESWGNGLYYKSLDTALRVFNEKAY